MQVGIDVETKTLELRDPQTANGYISMSFETLGVLNGMIAKAVKAAEDATPPQPPKVPA